MSDRPLAVVLAGPNGSGKSTTAEVLLPHDMTFINADMIAQELSGERNTAADLRAGRILLERLDVLVEERRSFAVETTLATKKLQTKIHLWEERGFETHLIFFYLPSPELALERVAARVRAGGHDVPPETIRRRYASGLRLFFGTYQGLVDSWRMYDNARIADPKLIASGRKGKEPECADPDQYQAIRRRWTG